MRSVVIFILTAMLMLFTGCEVTETTAFEPKITVNCYAYSDSTLDSVFVSRNARVNELIKFDNLKLSNADAKLYEDGSLIGQLVEYDSRKGVYHLPESLDFRFKIGKKYKLTVSHPSYPAVYAETTAPDTLKNMRANFYSSIQPMNSNGKIDTVEYTPGSNFIDNIYFKCSFDYSEMIKKRLGIYQISPLHREKSFWLEDTTKVVWDEYNEGVRFFKDKENFGKDFYYWFEAELYVNWLSFYSKDLNYVRFGSMDEVRYQFLADQNNQEEGHIGNIINGNGLFTITSYNKKVYKVYITDNLE